MVEILLTQGYITLIDDEDYELVSQYKWCATKCDKKFYVKTVNKEDGKSIYMHRLIMSAQPGEEVDHKNGNGLDNYRKNLRFCTSQQNKHNRRKTNGVSQYKGVSWDRKRNLWKAKICLNYKTIFLGRYKSEEQAALAYNSAALELFGDFACFNVIEK